MLNDHKMKNIRCNINDDTKLFDVVMLGHKRIPSREGGIEIVVEELATRMVERGHQVTVYNRRGKHVFGAEVEKVDEYKGIQIKTVATIDKKGLAAMTSSFTAALKAAFSKADVVHIHAEGPAAICWIPKLRGKKVVVTVHGLDWQRAKWGGFATKYIKLGEKLAAKWADEIIVLSQGVQDYFWKTYGRKTTFIPNGVNKPKSVPAQMITEKWGLRKDSYVLFLGRIVPEKGLRYLIEAWKNIKTDKKLVVAGGSSDTEDFMKEMQALAGEEAIFTGFQQGQVLEELYSNSYIYCLPSDLEGMPLSLLEAMSYGNCCLVSDIQECLEVIEDKAAIFKKSDTDDLRRVLQALLDNPKDVEKYKKEAADFVCQKYSWNEVVDKTLEIYS